MDACVCTYAYLNTQMHCRYTYLSIHESMNPFIHLSHTGRHAPCIDDLPSRAVPAQPHLHTWTPLRPLKILTKCNVPDIDSIQGDEQVVDACTTWGSSAMITELTVHLVPPSHRSRLSADAERPLSYRPREEAQTGAIPLGSTKNRI